MEAPDEQVNPVRRNTCRWMRKAKHGSRLPAAVAAGGTLCLPVEWMREARRRRIHECPARLSRSAAAAGYARLDLVGGRVARDAGTCLPACRRRLSAERLGRYRSPKTRAYLPVPVVLPCGGRSGNWLVTVSLAAASMARWISDAAMAHSCLAAQQAPLKSTGRAKAFRRRKRAAGRWRIPTHPIRERRYPRRLLHHRLCDD